MFDEVPLPPDNAEAASEVSGASASSLSLLDAVLPAEGWRCMWAKKAGESPKQTFHRNNADLAAQLKAFDAKGWDVYFCTSTLKERGNRKAANVHALRAFRMDADVKQGAYATAREAARDVLSFLLPLGFQATLVNSGYGLHVYIVLNDALPPEQWQPAAQALDQRAKAAGLHLDHAVTTDLVRILRPPGTHNRKKPESPQPVTLLYGPFSNPTSTVLRVLGAAGTGQTRSAQQATKGHSSSSNASGSFLGDMHGSQPPALAARVAELCPQLRAMRDARQAAGSIWYDLIGVLAFCEDGDQAAQEWSSAHPNYTAAEVDQKLAQWRKLTGPATCETIGQRHPAGCGACPHRGTVTTPVQLGRADAEQRKEKASLAADEADEPTLRDKVINAVLNAGTEFWRDADGVAYATVPQNQTLFRYRVRSGTFSTVARRIFGRAHPVFNPRGGTRPGSVSDAVMSECIPAFEAMAFDGAVKNPSVRICRSAASIILDLGDDEGRAVEVTAAGWTVLQETKAPLIRPNGLRALPVPIRDPDALRKLRNLLNLEKGPSGENDFILVTNWCLCCLWPDGPYPVLALDGEQGAAKSTTCRNLRKLVDPNKSDLRSPPRNEDDMLIAAISSRVIAWDNISFIDGERADSICRLATGGGFGKRKNYADLDEVIISVMRPILLNGIPSLLARGDLADRAIAITLPTIPDAERRTDSDMEDDFAAAAPSILALLLDGISMALRRLPGLKTRDLPRMADFARLAIAAAPAFGWTEAQIVAALASNRAAATGAVLDNDQVAVAVQALAVKQPTWTGNATALLEALVRTSPPDTPRERGWPRTANSLGQKLRRLAPALRRAGVIISLDRTGKDGQRIITISRLPE